MPLVITPVVLPSGRGVAFLAGTAAFTREGRLPGASMVTAVDAAKTPTVRVNGGAPVAASRAHPFWWVPVVNPGFPTTYPMPALCLFYTDLAIAPTDTVTATWADGAWTTGLGPAVAAADAPALNLSGSTLFADESSAPTPTMPVGWNLAKCDSNSAVYYYENVFCNAGGVAYSGAILHNTVPSVDVGLNISPAFYGQAGATGGSAPTVANVPPGDYLLKWDGASGATLGCNSATCVESGAATITGAADNTRHYTLGADATHYGPDLFCRVTATVADPGGGYAYDFRNPRLYRASTTLTDASQLRPEFVARVSCQSTRFLDPLGSNGGNATDWEDYQGPEDRIVRTYPPRIWEVPIARIEGYSGLAGTPHGFDPAYGVSYLFTTATPHLLSLHQYVSIYGFNGNPPIQIADGSGNTDTVNLDGFTGFCIPITATTFVMYGGKRGGYSMVGVATPAHCYTHIEVGNGMALRDLVAICNAANTDFYFNTTAQATEDALTRCAEYVAANLAPGLKFRVEGLNEVWNFGFPVNGLAAAMSYALYGIGNNYPYPWAIETAQRHWGWMKAAWVAGGRDPADFVRVQGSQGANTGVTDIVAGYCHDKGYTFDEMCIGGYLFNQNYRSPGFPSYESGMAATLDAFGTDPACHLDLMELNYTLGNWEGLFPAHRDALSGKRVDFQGNVTHLYPEFAAVPLIVYEGGPDHLAMFGGAYGDSPVLNHAAACHPRWHGIYQGILRTFQDTGCTLFHDFDYSDAPRHDGTSWTAHIGTDQQDYQPGDAAQDAVQVDTPSRLDLVRSVTGGALRAWAQRVAGVFVPPSPDFTLSVAGPLSVAAGASAPVAVTLHAAGGYTGTATLAVSGLAAGVTGSFSPAAVTGGGVTASTLTVAASGSASAGTTTATVTGHDAANALTHTATLAVTVTAQGGSSPPPAPSSPASGGTVAARMRLRATRRARAV